MCSLPAFSGPSGMRTVRGKPAPRLGGLQGKCVLRGACLQKEQEGDASLRGGGNDTGGFCWGETMLFGGWSRSVSGDEEAGCEDRAGHTRSLVENQVQVLRGYLGGSNDIREFKTITEIILWGFSEVKQVKCMACVGHIGLDQYSLAKKGLQSLILPSTPPFCTSPTQLMDEKTEC